MRINFELAGIVLIGTIVLEAAIRVAWVGVNLTSAGCVNYRM